MPTLDWLLGQRREFDPRFAQIFSRNKISGKYLDINHNLVIELKNMNLWDMVKSKIVELQGDISSIEEIPPHIREIYKTSFSVSPYAFIEVAARAQKWVDQALSRNMYLEDRDIDKTMDIYSTAWRKGVKTTYYLHMKPRHTAEQSTVAVNKAEKLGKFGFASVFKTAQINADNNADLRGKENVAKVAVEVAREDVEKEEVIDQQATPKTQNLTPTNTEHLLSHQIFSNVQTQIPLKKETEEIQIEKNVENHNHYQTKIIEGKTYRVHMPSDPQENFTCDGCQ